VSAWGFDQSLCNVTNGVKKGASSLMNSITPHGGGLSPGIGAKYNTVYLKHHLSSKFYIALSALNNFILRRRGTPRCFMQYSPSLILKAAYFAFGCPWERSWSAMVVESRIEPGNTDANRPSLSFLLPS